MWPCKFRSFIESHTNVIGENHENGHYANSNNNWGLSTATRAKKPSANAGDVQVTCTVS